MKYILIAFTVIITSFYFFPFNFRFLPAVNTKMGMAALGLVVLAVQLARNRNAQVDKDFFFLSLFAAFVSLAGLFSVIYNNTTDFAYASYLVSMWVWSSAAYVVVSLIRYVHGTVSVYLLCNYLIALCVAQCVLALTMDMNESVQQFVFSIQVEGVGEFLDQKKRLSGLGAALDIAGSRFSAVLIMISYLCVNYLKEIRKYLYLYILAFVIIAVIGNMIGRTTTVGMLIAIAYLIFGSIFLMSSEARTYVWSWMSGVLIIAVPVFVYLYNNVPDLYENLRFGFEGFFSLVEKGRWEVHSNEMLKHGYIFPDNPKTWLIGDGYFGTTFNDPYYTGVDWGGFYKGSDVGYSRFLFYFGLAGLGAFSVFMIKTCQVCVKRFWNYRYLFLLILALNFIVWLKVSTDIFLVFAPFLCISKEENDAYVERMELRSMQ